MPIEAMRLGCEVAAIDLNPVAYLALIGSLVYPRQYATTDRLEQSLAASEMRLASRIDQAEPTPVVLPGMENQEVIPGHDLAEDVRYWAEWVLQQAEAQIGECYPPDAEGIKPVSYLWAKTIDCPHCGGRIPLLKRTWLQDGAGHEPIAFVLKVDKETPSYKVNIVRGQAALDADPNKGTLRGATVVCIYCGVPSERSQIIEQGQASTLGQELLVVVLHREGQTGRDFRPADDRDSLAYDLAQEKLEAAKAEGFDFWGFDRLLSVTPDEPTPHARSRATAIRQYGITDWSQMYNDRQLLAHIILGQQIRLARQILSAEDPGYARCIALYLSFVLAKQVVYNSKGAWWQSDGLKIAPVMARRDIPITWDYAEANPFSGYASSWQSFIGALWPSIENAAKVESTPPTIVLGSATRLPTDWTGQFDAVITDPPYYDSVNYSDLSDYFYVWHKRVIGDDYAEAFVTDITPKQDEIIQDVLHGGTKTLAKQYYEDSMAQAFAEMHRVLKDDGIAVIMFAHKNSSAWETLVNALIRAGFQVTASWPLNTEGRRLQSYRAVALASSIYLVCRKRPTTGQRIGYLEDLESELRKTIRRYLERFWAAGIGGADFFMSAIGPGLSVYSRHASVERYDGKQVDVTEFLNLVRHETAAFAIERIVGQAGFSDQLDALTQFYILWCWGYNSWDVPDGEALLFSTAVGVELNLLIDKFGLVGKVKGKMHLLGPWARKHLLDKTTERVVAGGAVPLVDVLQKACLLWDSNQQEELASLIAARGGELWPVAQAIVELLPKDNPERRALNSMLGARLTLESRAQTWANEHISEPKVIQGTLWDDNMSELPTAPAVEHR
jgi:adenine-specific DNA methylase